MNAITKILAGIFPKGSFEDGYLDPCTITPMFALVLALSMWIAAATIGIGVIMMGGSPLLLIQPGVVVASTIISSVAIGAIATEPGQYTAPVVLTGSAAVVPVVVLITIGSLLWRSRAVAVMPARLLIWIIYRAPMAIGARLAIRRRGDLPRAVAKKVLP